MTSVTHVPFGILMAEFAVTSFNYEANNAVVALAALGSLLPDIDHPNSVLGRIFHWTGLPQYLERRFGHRTITHSWLFLLAEALVTVPFLFTYGVEHYLALFFGVLSHIAIDMANKSGVPFFWPARGRWVIPPVERYRIRVGSPAEFILAAVLFVSAAAFTPVSYMGLRSAFYRITRDIYGAANESRKYFPDYELVAHVQGTWRDSQVPTDYEEEFRVIAVASDNLYLSRGDAVFATGSATPKGPSFTLDRILVLRKARTVRTSHRLPFDHQLIDEVAGEIPDGAVVTGTLVAEPLTEEERNDNYTTTSEEFPTIVFVPHGREAEEIEITYCPAERLRRALLDRGVFVLSGQLTVTTSTAYRSTGGAAPAARVSSL